MKKLILLLPVCIFLVLSSCSKKNTPTPSLGGTGTITFAIGGAAQTFNVNAYATYQNLDGLNFLTIYGLKNAGTTDKFELAIVNSSIIEGTTYTGVASQVQLTYTLASGAVYQYADDDAAAFVSVVIKSVTSTNVQGTFSGNLNLISGNGPAKQVLTNGTFNLRIEPGSN
jgi:hypothetical protein